jgi:hypothetical protein
MKKLIKHKIFIGAFLLTYFLFFAITIYVLEIKKSGFGVGSMNYGFPFTYYTSTCFGGDYSWFGLIGNILFAAILSFVSGLISTQYWLKFSSPEFRAKWHI